MLNIKQNNIRLLAIEKGERINNFLDCDVVHDAIEKLKSYDEKSDPARLCGSLSYLVSAINYRKGNSTVVKALENLLLELHDTIPNLRKCQRCNDPLEQNDDLVCGYHHLEA